MKPDGCPDAESCCFVLLRQEQKSVETSETLNKNRTRISCISRFVLENSKWILSSKDCVLTSKAKGL